MSFKFKGICRYWNGDIYGGEFNNLEKDGKRYI
uniref:Uncharacterized protein n=1 Tax=viral metagenome TaxID=1070528 RepID=A0A6C0ADZ6_9ZZZZ